MSKELGRRTVVIPTDLGGMSVTTKVISDFDIEDIIRAKSESQALVIQMANRGRDTKSKSYEDGSLTSVFTTETEELDE